MDGLPVTCPWVGALWKCQCRPNKRSLHTGSMTHQQSRLLCPTNKDRQSQEVGHPGHSSLLHQLAISCNYKFTFIALLNHFGVLRFISHHLHRKTCRDICSHVWVLTQPPGMHCTRWLCASFRSSLFESCKSKDRTRRAGFGINMSRPILVLGWMWWILTCSNLTFGYTIHLGTRALLQTRGLKESRDLYLLKLNKLGWVWEQQYYSIAGYCSCRIYVLHIISYYISYTISV